MKTVQKRQIITIDQSLCNGCGDCITGCPEGALQIVDGKARLVGDLLCDGLGACIGQCPAGAITIEERDAEPYDEIKVMENMIQNEPAAIATHLHHLQEHGDKEHWQQAVDFLRKKNIPVPTQKPAVAHSHGNHGGCPGSKIIDRTHDAKPPGDTEHTETNAPSQLRQWPVQLHLINPMAPYYQQRDVVLAADCTAFAVGNFHSRWLAGKSLAIACPKLDDGQDVYAEKIRALIDDAKINTLTVIIMEVPCCGGLLAIAQDALRQSQRKIPIKLVVVGLDGEIRQEEWIQN